jgi:hypothetical protein
MGDITTKFVTSFSELYVQPAQTGWAGAHPGNTAVRNWFTAGTNVTDVGCITFVAGASGDVNDTITITTDNGDFSASVDTTGTADQIAANVISALEPLSATMSVSASTTAGSTAADVSYQLAPGFGDLTGVDFSLNDGAPALSGADSTADETIGAVIIPLVSEIGTISNEANIIETPTFGDKFKGKLRGQLDAGTLDASVYWAPRDPMHILLRELATNGDAVSFGIKWKTDADGTDTEYVVFDGYVSSFGIDSTFDDVAKASTTLVIDGALYFADAA